VASPEVGSAMDSALVTGFFAAAGAANGMALQAWKSARPKMIFWIEGMVVKVVGRSSLELARIWKHSSAFKFNLRWWRGNKVLDQPLSGSCLMVRVCVGRRK